MLPIIFLEFDLIVESKSSRETRECVVNTGLKLCLANLSFKLLLSLVIQLPQQLYLLKIRMTTYSLLQPHIKPRQTQIMPRINHHTANHAINIAIEGNESSQHLGDSHTIPSHAYHSFKSDTKGNTPKIVHDIQGNFPRCNTASLHASLSKNPCMHATVHRTHSKAIQITANFS
jgi:hypothetical protein